MLCGKLPYSLDTLIARKESVYLKGIFSNKRHRIDRHFDPPFEKWATPEARELIRSMLAVKPKERFDIRDVDGYLKQKSDCIFGDRSFGLGKRERKKKVMDDVIPLALIIECRTSV